MDDLTGEFITETTDSLAVLDAELMKLEHTPGDTAVLGNIARLVHTIKGTCGFLNLPRLETVAASGERLLVTIREEGNAVTPPALLLLLEMLARIKGLIAYLAEHGTEPEGDDAKLIAQLDKFSPSAMTPDPVIAAAVVMPEKKQTVKAAKPQPAPTPAVKTPEPVAQSAPALEAKPQTAVTAPVMQATAPEPASLTTKAKQEAIRHGLETHEPEGLRDRLMQLTAELVTVRNALAEHIRHRDEPELRDLLRRMSQVTTGLRKEIGQDGPRFTTPVTPVLMVETAGMKFALPQESIVQLVRMDNASEYAQSAHVMRLHGKIVPLLSLRHALQLAPASSGKDYVAVLRLSDVEFGIIVDRIHDLEELVLTRMGGVLADLGLYRGSSVLGDGSVALMLEPEGLARALGVALKQREAQSW